MSNDEEFWTMEAEEHRRMSAKGNIKGEQPLPLEIPEQPTDRFRVWQVPGLRVWFVWDTATDEPVDLPSGERADCEHLADLLNYAHKASS